MKLSSEFLSALTRYMEERYSDGWQLEYLNGPKAWASHEAELRGGDHVTHWRSATPTFMIAVRDANRSGYYVLDNAGFHRVSALDVMSTLRRESSQPRPVTPAPTTERRFPRLDA